MDNSRIDVFLADDGGGYVILPAGGSLPEGVARALGGLRHGWTQDIGAAASLPGWRALRNDIDACGYSVLSYADFAALLLPSRLRDAGAGIVGGYPVAA